MKKLFPSLVAVKRITSAVPRSNFAEPELEKLARLILDSGGLINPIIVRRKGMDAYEIVDGDFEYYAAARAKEIEPLKGETIGAFILEEENEKILLEQLEILRKTAITENLVENPETGFFYENTSSQPADLIKNPVSLVEVHNLCENETPQEPSSLEQRLTNIEAQFANQINELKAEYAREQKVLAQSIQELENRLLQQVPLLVEAGIANRINELKSESLPEKQAVVERIPEVENLASESMSLLEALNTLDKNQLSANLKDAGLKLPIIQIILKERDVRPFVSFANVVERVKGLADKTMIKIIDKWHKYS
ncbi:ParB domain protein nuclease [Oscillatoria nigro-viridis PCC 7112]|uniref:ParB domain protein nuclease n=1 Tax=Phormidium nigroviride PCC 7112 TaxID=179408 RepID=K9VJV0_9CYAN|nr:ParB N-terminal domain-containing protein [Oscillatoria nigro-viridis]AFZ08226.1 ParB domain protein nuclease [Oscillatoria nigro-viridis PCC 7112]